MVESWARHPRGRLLMFVFIYQTGGHQAQTVGQAPCWPLGGEIKIHKTLEMEALEDRRGIIVIFFYSSVSTPEKRGIATHHESFTTEH